MNYRIAGLTPSFFLFLCNASCRICGGFVLHLRALFDKTEIPKTTTSGKEPTKQLQKIMLTDDLNPTSCVDPYVRGEAAKLSPILFAQLTSAYSIGHEKSRHFIWAVVFIHLVFIGSTLGQAGFSTPSLNGLVTATYVQPDKKILIGGTFWTVSGQTRSSFARLNADGTLDTSFQDPNCSPTGFPVRAVAVQSDGKILIGGEFNSVGGQTRSFIARLNSDGTLDPTFAAGADKRVLAIVIQSDGKIVIGGEFTTVNGQARGLVARLNSDGTLDTSFQNPSVAHSTPGVTPTVWSIALQPDNKFLIAGWFDSVAGVTRRAVARLNSDGSLDSTFQDPIVSGSGTPGVKSIDLLTDMRVVIGGSFGTVGGQVRTSVARLNADGSLDSSLQDPQIKYNGDPGYIDKLQVQSDSKIIIGGGFDQVGGQPRERAARLNTDGSVDTGFADPLIDGGVFQSLTLQPDGKIVLGGAFLSVSTRPRKFLARLTSAGTLDVPDPQTFVVTKVADTDDGICDADCSLREAVAAANNSESDDTILFDPTLFSTSQSIVLTKGQLAICNTGTLVVNGSGADRLNISGNDQSRIMRVWVGGTLTLNNVTISHGNTLGGNPSTCPAGQDYSVGGGGIENRGTLYINNSIITDNAATGSGGGVSNVYGTTTISNSIIRNNTATSGYGGIANVGILSVRIGSLTLINSTVSGNSVPSNLGNGGGGIGNDDGATLWVINSTISGNSTGASGGAINNIKGTVYLSNATIVGNSAGSGGGISNPNTSPIGFIYSRNTIIADNTAPSKPDGTGVLTSQGFNLIKNTAGLIISGDMSGNQLNVDPMLDPLLKQNGGFAPTHALLAGSPAIDKGAATAGITTDQRGRFRPNDFLSIPNAVGGDGSDIGAYEVSNGRVSPFDFDGDGKTDIGVFRPGASAEWWISRSADNGVFSASFGAAGDQPVPADYTGDGKTDIAFFRPSTGTWYVLRSEDNTFFGFPFGSSADVTAPADYDGDGKADPAVFRNGAWYILRSSDGGVTSAQFGVAGDKPVPADYDGDGKADLAIYRPNGGTGGEWWILRSTAGLFAATFGSSTDKTVVGDWTGDGKADCAFFRPSDSTWYILRSEDQSFFGFPFGIATDTPAPGDYDGDGKTDAAVFRSPAAAWYVNKSSGGVLSQSFGAAGDSPVPGSYVR